MIDWLLGAEHSDPSIRWQVMRDLLDAPEPEWKAERAKVETEGWGARLLAREDDDGRWAGGALVSSDFRYGEEEGQPWISTSPRCRSFGRFGFDPSSNRARRSVELIGANCHWEHDGQPFWEGELEPCINGVTVANGAYFGVHVAPVVERLVRSAHPSTPRSMFSKVCSNSSAPPAALLNPRRHAAGARSTC